MLILSSCLFYFALVVSPLDSGNILKPTQVNHKASLIIIKIFGLRQIQLTTLYNRIAIWTFIILFLNIATKNCFLTFYIFSQQRQNVD